MGCNCSRSSPDRLTAEPEKLVLAEPESVGTASVEAVPVELVPVEPVPAESPPDPVKLEAEELNTATTMLSEATQNEMPTDATEPTEAEVVKSLQQNVDLSTDSAASVALDQCAVAKPAPALPDSEDIDTAAAIVSLAVEDAIAENDKATTDTTEMKAPVRKSCGDFFHELSPRLSASGSNLPAWLSWVPSLCQNIGSGLKKS